MSLSYSRLTHIYKRLPRPGVIQTFPRHVFVREPNHPGEQYTKSQVLLVKQY